MTPLHLEPVPEVRAEGARAVAGAALAARRIVLTTHVNADGDGVGSEVAMVHLLRALGKSVAIANPTPIPDRYRFLLEPLARHDRSADATQALRDADLFLVLDISDAGRLGHLADTIRTRGILTACIDHHLSPGTLPDGPRLVAADASATAELVYDLAVTSGWTVDVEAARALYVGILTDTGGFRFSNTTPRVLRVAGSLLEAGVDPERLYESVYATAPIGRIRLTAEVLETLVVEPEIGLSWVTVPAGALQRHGVTADDLDGLVEFARSVQGTRLALLFRQLANGKIKVSLRSVGDLDVSAFAKQFGGGGHAKASGASVAGSLDEVQRLVLGAARGVLAPRGASG
ncbi:MAG: bifunctional oligoribonuclease/PAP phosphatase NrnA [Gemmatimonadetes bacterium]|nr:bifunctional oligoribonuclease/PAP phosphatase NrnA [Gemmatimonadota bacterium]